MRVAAEVRRLVNEPHLQVHDENALGMLLRPGSMEFGPPAFVAEMDHVQRG
jgi:hypothetical protein